jgi:hypothetical protein
MELRTEHGQLQSLQQSASHSHVPFSHKQLPVATQSRMQQHPKLDVSFMFWTM